MTKKHLITCSVMMVLVIISGLNICSTEGSARVEKSVKLSPRIAKYIFKNTDDAADYSFANEALPTNEAGVKHTFKRALQRDSYKTVQSNILQVKAWKLFPVIEPILKAYGIPDDFKYVPLVETGLCEGTSPKGARGIWQFMPGTARLYGLKVGDGVDERLNIHKSTIAACRYIKDLYNEFNSWTLAAAAYNDGSIKVERAISRQNEDNYYLLHLNYETATYVYDIIAMKQVITEPEKYGYKDYFKVSKPSELLAFK
jgi:membrane-bound lytic murein transglycosylase D